MKDKTCYQCGAPARFSADKRADGYPDLEADADDMVTVPLCRDCRSQIEDDEPIDFRGL